VELQTLVDEYASVGLGEYLYHEVLETVRVVSRYYPVNYSPTRRWDEDALTGLAHDWAITKLLRYGQLEHLLLANQTLAGFRQGLALSFRNFLISQKDRTALDNLFHRANALLERDPQFRLFGENTKKADRLWGLASWQEAQPYQGQEAELIAIGLGLEGFPMIQYREDAKKHSPILSEADLTRFLRAVLEAAGGLLSLRQFALVFQYRFHLLEAEEISLETPLATDSEGHPLQVGDLMSAGRTGEEVAIVNEAASSLLDELSLRQKQALLAHAQPGATLTSVADQLGCSKSTVDNEIRRTLGAIHRYAETEEEAKAIYARLLELLSPE
jgi:predicted DNA-binding protein YlxM (UPF0122 family)